MQGLMECRTADDVRALARRVDAWHRAQWSASPPVVPVEVIADPPPPPRPELPRSIVPRSVHRQVIEVVCAHFELSRAQLCGPRRMHSLVQARQLAAYLMRKLGGYSLPAIGQHLGDRDHTTIMHAVQRMEGKIAVNAGLAALVAELEQACARRARC